MHTKREGATKMDAGFFASYNLYPVTYCTSQIEAATSPGIWLACSNSLPSGKKSHSNAPPIRTKIPLLKGKFCFQWNTVHTFQRGICHDDTFKLFLKTLWKELFPNNGKILSCKSVKPCKNPQKNSRAYYARIRDKSGSNSPPFQGNIQIPPSPGKNHSQMPGGGGVLKLQFDWYISWQYFFILMASFCLL